MALPTAVSTVTPQTVATFKVLGLSVVPCAGGGGGDPEPVRPTVGQLWPR